MACRQREIYRGAIHTFTAPHLKRLARLIREYLHPRQGSVACDVTTLFGMRNIHAFEQAQPNPEERIASCASSFLFVFDWGVLCQCHLTERCRRPCVRGRFLHNPKHPSQGPYMEEKPSPFHVFHFACLHTPPPVCQCWTASSLNPHINIECGAGGPASVLVRF